MAGEVEVFESSGGHAFGAWRDVFVAVWRTTTTSDAATRMAAVIRRFAARHAGGIAMIVVIEPACAMPDGATRELMARDMKRHEPFTRHMVTVFEGDGFAAAIVRSVVAGMQLLSRQVVPTATVATVPQAAAWLSGKRPPGTLSAEEIVSAVGAIRAAAMKPG